MALNVTPPKSNLRRAGGRGGWRHTQPLIRPTSTFVDVSQDFPAEAENGRPLAVRHMLDLVACDRTKVHREPVNAKNFIIYGFLLCWQQPSINEITTKQPRWVTHFKNCFLPASGSNVKRFYFFIICGFLLCWKQPSNNEITTERLWHTLKTFFFPPVVPPPNPIFLLLLVAASSTSVAALQLPLQLSAHVNLT